MQQDFPGWNETCKQVFECLDRKFLVENSFLAAHTGTGTTVLYEMLLYVDTRTHASVFIK